MARSRLNSRRSPPHAAGRGIRRQRCGLPGNGCVALFQRGAGFGQRGLVGGEFAFGEFPWAVRARSSSLSVSASSRVRRVNCSCARCVSSRRRIFSGSAVAAGFGGLALEGIRLALHLREHVGQAREVDLGLLELAGGVASLGLVFRDAGRLFEDGPAILGPRGQDQVDLALFHDGIGGPADARVHEELLDVAQAAEGFVEEVFALAVAVDAPRNAHLVVRGAELFLAIGEGHRHLGHADRLAGVRAVEDHVGHLAAAQGLGGLLAQAPADRVEHVALAAAVGPDDGGHAEGEVEFGFLGERLEPENFQTAKMHGGRVSKGQNAQAWKEKVARAFKRSLNTGRLSVVSGQTYEPTRSRCRRRPRSVPPLPERFDRSDQGG